MQLQTVSQKFDKHFGLFKSSFQSECVFVSVGKVRWGQTIQSTLGDDFSGLE